MFGMLIAILRFDVVPVERGRTGKGEVAFVLSFGIGDRMIAGAIARSRPCRVGTWCETRMVRPLPWSFWKALRHCNLIYLRAPLFS